MGGLGIFVAFAGYSFAYYGATQINGWNYGFLDLVIPGRWAKASRIPNDNPKVILGAATKATPNKPNPNTQHPGQNVDPKTGKTYTINPGGTPHR